MKIKAVLMAMGMVSCGLAQAALTSGTYVTEGKGNNGPVEVETTIENGAITKIRVLKNSETPMIGGTTALSSTAFNSGGSKIQMAQNKPYTADDYYLKLKGKGPDDASLRNLADLSGPTTDWLVDMGADLGRVINGSQHTQGRRSPWRHARSRHEEAAG